MKEFKKASQEIQDNIENSDKNITNTPAKSEIKKNNQNNVEDAKIVEE
jgi:hypothetical protein